LPAPSVQRPVDFTWLVPLVLVAHGLAGWAVLSKRSEPPEIEPRVMEVSVSLSPAQQPAVETKPLPPAPPPPQPRPQPQPARTAAPAPVAKAPAAVALPASAATNDAPTAAPQTEPAPAAPAPASEPAPIVPPSFSAAYLENPAPAYPPVSRKLGESGRVMLRVRVSVDGRAEAVELLTSSGFGRLDKAAQDAVKHWRFVPARQAGKPVEAWVQVPVSFDLNN
jgi:protein TonB